MMCDELEWNEAVEQWLDMGDGAHLAAKLLDEHRDELVQAIAEALAYGSNVIDLCLYLPLDWWLNEAAIQISRYASSRQGEGDEPA